MNAFRTNAIVSVLAAAGVMIGPVASAFGQATFQGLGILPGAHSSRANAISADGPANLLNAVRVAVSREAVGKGVLVVLNEDIGAARDVWKTHNQRVDTFRSPELGFLGYVDPDAVVFHRETLRPHTTESPFDVSELDALPRVDIVSDYAGSDGAILTRLV